MQPSAVPPQFKEIIERAQQGGALTKEDIENLPEETKKTHADQYALYAVNEALPWSYRALARARRAGLALEDVVAVIIGRDQPPLRDDPELLARTPGDKLITVMERHTLADLLEKHADATATDPKGVTYTFSVYREHAVALRAAPAAPGVLRTLALVYFVAHRYEANDLGLGEAPDPDQLDAIAADEDKARALIDAKLAAENAARKAEAEKARSAPRKQPKRIG